MEDTIDYTVRTPHADTNKDTTYDLRAIVDGIPTRILVDTADADQYTLHEYATVCNTDDADWDVYAQELCRSLSITKTGGNFYLFDQKINEENNRASSEVRWVEDIVRRVIMEIRQKEIEERY